MSKKNNKNISSDVVNSTSENCVQNVEQNVELSDSSIKVSENFIKDSKLCVVETLPESHIIPNFNLYKLNNMGLFDLIQLEKACSLLCKRFETSARLDCENNEKFKEYKGYYDKIFSELEKRVSEICK